MALVLNESNHDLRATRILLGRMNAKLECMADGDAGLQGRTAPSQ